MAGGKAPRKAASRTPHQFTGIEFQKSKGQHILKNPLVVRCYSLFLLDVDLGFGLRYNPGCPSTLADYLTAVQQAFLCFLVMVFRRVKQMTQARVYFSCDRQQKGARAPIFHRPAAFFKNNLFTVLCNYH